MIEIYRKSIDSISIEIPRGFSEEGEQGRETAKRELYEELHYVCNKLIDIGYIYPDSGLQNAKVNLYLAFDVKFTDSYVQSEENIKKILEL